MSSFSAGLKKTCQERKQRHVSTPSVGLSLMSTLQPASVTLMEPDPAPLREPPVVRAGNPLPPVATAVASGGSGVSGAPATSTTPVAPPPSTNSAANASAANAPPSPPPVLFRAHRDVLRPTDGTEPDRVWVHHFDSDVFRYNEDGTQLTSVVLTAASTCPARPLRTTRMPKTAARC